MKTDILKAIKEPDKHNACFVLFDAFNMKDADMVCKGVFGMWPEIMGYIHGRISGVNIKYTVREYVTDYYVIIEILYGAGDAIDLGFPARPGDLQVAAKYRVYIC